MEKQYWLHRISYEAELSYPLLKNGVLTVGWGRISNKTLLTKMKAIDDNHRHDFDALVRDELAQKNIVKPDKFRSYACRSIWIFSRIKAGDVVLVPQFNGTFSLYKVTGEMQPIGDIDLDTLPEKLIDTEGNVIEKKDGLLCPVGSNDPYDLGFFIPVEQIKIKIRRSLASPMLQSRMKVRQTNSNISDLQDAIEKICKLPDGNPLERENFHDAIVGHIQSLTALEKYFIPAEFENLVCIYMKKIGADSVDIPSKNEPGKEDRADADVVAYFETLKVRVYIQVKCHNKDTATNAWAIQQIRKYKEQKDEQGNDEYTSLAWVLSSAGKFSDEAIQQADVYGVRLINGKEFIEMLLDAGIKNIHEAVS